MIIIPRIVRCTFGIYLLKCVAYECFIVYIEQMYIKVDKNKMNFVNVTSLG